MSELPPPREDAPSDDAQPPPEPGRRILVVEDSSDVARLLCLLLKAMGYTVEMALDGQSAIALVRTFRPQAVLLDVGLPDLDGFEVARRLRAEHGPRPCLVALTGFGEEDDRARGRAAGFDHYLLKPPDLNRLRHILATLPS